MHFRLLDACLRKIFISASPACTLPNLPFQTIFIGMRDTRMIDGIAGNDAARFSPSEHGGAVSHTDLRAFFISHFKP
jgi:hypothetical protein